MLSDGDSSGLCCAVTLGPLFVTQPFAQALARSIVQTGSLSSRDAFGEIPARRAQAAGYLRVDSNGRLHKPFRLGVRNLERFVDVR